jgi:pimeloyl-ACP methyl ester carboxylesterase
MTLRLEPIVEGPDSGETLVFIQGWPDDATLWNEQVASLAARYRCVRTTMPNFDGRRTARWGYSTEEIVAALAEMVREVSPDAPVTLILHDWGCYWGSILHRRNPDLVARVASLDVAPHVEPSPGAMLGIIAYQWWLIGAFVLGGPIGDWMTRSLAAAMGAPMPSAQINSWMNYPYRNAWRDILSGRAREQTEDYWPAVPLLFVYGKKKPFPFHSKKWVQHVESTGGTVVGLDCGHWVPRDPAFGEILESWLDGRSADSGRTASSRRPGIPA